MGNEMSAVRRLWLGAVLSGCVGVAWAQGAETSSIQQGGTSADQRSVAIAAQRDGASATQGMEPMSTRGAFALPGLFHSSDTDGLSIDKVSASYWPNYQSGSQWQGVEVQTQRYAQGGTNLHAQTLAYGYSAIDPRTGMGLNWRAGWNQGLGNGLAVGELNWNQTVTERLSWGVFASRDWVESIGALQQSIHYDLVGGSVDYQLHPRLTAIGSLAYTKFSDGQDRQQQRARLVWDAWPEQGLTLQWAYKRQYGASDGVRRTYFNPQQLDESLGFIGWRRRFEGWQVYARAGWGYQKLLDQDHTPARSTELQLTSPVYGQRFFRLRAGYTDTLGLNGPGYGYRYVDAQWVWRL
jgi:hypothetical protein